MTTLLQDVRYGVRLLLRTPGFSLVAIVTLALGIGANTAIFSVVHALLLRPLPYPAAGRLVMVFQDFSARGERADEWATPGNYVDWRADKKLFRDLAAVSGWQPALTGVGQPEPLVGEQVTSGYFDVLGVPAAFGRTFTDSDMVPNAPRVAILSDALWQRRFGGQRDVLGRIVTLGGDPHEIIGVMPPQFRPAVIPAAQLWRPRQLNTANPSRGAVVLRVVARLQDGLSLPQAQSAATVLSQALERAHPDSNTKAGISLISLHSFVVGDIRAGLLVLFGAVFFVLIIACVNIANLLLVRASARTREIAVRMALGAGRPRVVRQLLTESVLLAAAGGSVGLLIGVWGIAGLAAIAPVTSRSAASISLDWTVMLFTAALTVMTGMVFGLVPALQASRAGFTAGLRDGARGSTGMSGRSIRQSLIVAEVAIALMLLVGGGLLMRTLVRLQSVDLGFQSEGILVGQVLPPQAKYPGNSDRKVFYDRLLERMAALPGVEKAALTSVVPMGGGDSDTDIYIEGRPLPRTNDEATITWYRLVSQDYFELMGIALQKGRVFSASEAAPVVVVNETAVARLWPGEDPLGRRVRFSTRGDAPWFTIVGIVRDVRGAGPRAASRVETYVPYSFMPEPGISVVLKTSGAPMALASSLAQGVLNVDADTPVSGVSSLDTLVANSVAEPRFVATLVAIFAGLALTLAAIGIYGVTSYVVVQRTAEIGVRMALGADSRDVFGVVVGGALRLVAIGVAFGLAGALLLTRSLATLLFGIPAHDPFTFAAMTGVLIAVAAMAGAIPALRASRVDPVVALRTQ